MKKSRQASRRDAPEFQEVRREFAEDVEQIEPNGRRSRVPEKVEMIAGPR